MLPAIESRVSRSKSALAEAPTRLFLRRMGTGRKTAEHWHKQRQCHYNREQAHLPALDTAFARAVEPAPSASESA